MSRVKNKYESEKIIEERIKNRDICDEMSESYLEYSISVILDRAIPQLRDGLKPVQRRILYTMKNMDTFKKSARVVGEVMGHYHPKGDCLSGDTVIYALDNSFRTIRELCEEGVKELEVLAYDETNKTFVPTIAHSFRIGQRTNRVYKITMLDGSFIECTNNHPFYDRVNERWIKTEDIKEGALLITGDVSLRGKHKALSTSFDKRKEIMYFCLPEVQSEHVRHHFNFNPLDDRPSNIVSLTRGEHAETHKDYLVGLRKGHETMKNDPEIRATMKYNNSVKIKEIAKNYAIVRSSHYVRKLAEKLGIEFDSINEEMYNEYKYISYQVPNLSTVYSKGYTFNDIIHHAKEGFKLKTGLTLKSKKREPKGKSIESTRKPILRRIAKCFIELLKLDKNPTIENYVEMCESNRWLPSLELIENRVGTKDFNEILKILAHLGYFNTVKSIETYSVAGEPMYDFTVDKYENAVVVMNSENSDSTNFKFIVAHNSSIYGAIVRMAQNFRMYVPFITPQGNFGSLDASDSPSAMRYSECHIDPVSKDIFFTNNLLGMEYKDNYDSSELEPVCLTPMFPAILVNGTIGIAVGIATYIPTHNPIEVIKTYEAFIQGKLNNNNIRKYLKGPDPVIPCNVIDVNGGIDRAYRTGSGKYHCMSHYHVEDDTRGKKKLVFTSVLPSRSKDVDILNLVTKCRDQRNPLSQMIADIRDESSKEGIRVVVTIKKDITVEAAIEALIAARFCYDSFSISMRVIYKGRPMKLGIMDMMSHFHRMNSETTVVHLTALKENKERRLHILDGIELVIENYDTVIDIIRKSKGKEEARIALQKKYKGLSDIQVNAILDTKLYTLINKGDSIKAERKIIKEEVKEINHNLKDIDGYILNLLEDLKKTLKPYAKRRCEIINKIPKTPV